MWSHLDTLDNQQNLAREFELERLFAESIQGEKVVQYFYFVLLTLWAEQDQVISASIPVTRLKDFMTTMKGTRTVQFIMKLKLESEHFHVSILNREKLPALEVLPWRIPLPWTLPANSNKHVQCYHCKETGHIISHCKKRNYCNYCKKDDYIILECRKKSGPGKRSTPHKAFQAMAKDAGTREPPNTKVLDRNDIYKMIQESLVAALPNAISSALSATYPGKTKLSYSTVWHIDSAASYHMIGNKKLFSELSNPCSRHEIVTANGHALTALTIIYYVFREKKISRDAACHSHLVVGPSSTMSSTTSGTTYDFDPFLDNDTTSANINSLPHPHNASLNLNNQPSPTRQNNIYPIK
ncbi:hypothetical protein H5410_050426 [Solanum commersonii]|uniref:CCHC-type domain-containing protein n=1 Tax=Solanum commersonii TaxID=4109 RepID=A0A9J5WWR9_SOLCO|nr:hypothetical protein H5410_050426 [Solanum commersonii]